jgi:DNA ligase-associated metallophosphoesterase
MVETEVGGAVLRLHAQRAAELPALRTLLAADVHLGKAASFRRLGVPVPGGTTAETLQRLGALRRACGATRIVFLGDLLHSAHGRSAALLAQFADWRREHAAVELLLVRGNHDARAGDPPAALGITVVDEPLMLGGLALQHHPRPRADAYGLAGHLHPCIAVGARRGERLRLPCFHFGAEVGVLPAFGAFTGMHPVRPAAGDRVFAIAGDRVRALPLHTLAP